MREIKFRAYAKEELVGSQWIDNGYGVTKINYTDGTSSVHLLTPYGDYHVEEDSVGQYTGLNDKNGIEIYEGDIVHNEDWLGETKLKDDIIGEVIFSNGCFLIKTRYGNKYLYAGTNKVIGNIYENKYLLEELE